MSQFVQLHLLTPYHPSNLNRDDLGRPKTALVGGKQRLRVSSQSLKRAWRTSEVFQTAFPGQLGTRTKEMGCQVAAMLQERGVDPETAADWASKINGAFGKTKAKAPLEIEQLAHFSPEEREAIANLVERLAAGGNEPTEQDLELWRHPESAVDIALFGRMLAAHPAYNVEAALQVAHAFTVNQAPVEDDYFTAVDDLNDGQEDVGAGHVGETGFGAGVFYLYLCLDCGLLTKNLGDNRALAQKAARSLVRAVATVAPSGKQNSFASRSVAHYVLAERGPQGPRSLAAAFFQPVNDREDHTLQAIACLEKTRTDLDRAYGALSDAHEVMNVPGGRGTLAQVEDFVEQSL